MTSNNNGSLDKSTSKKKAGWYQSAENTKYFQWWNGKSFDNAFWPIDIPGSYGTYMPEWRRVNISENSDWQPQFDVVGENFHEAAIISAIGKQPQLNEEIEVLTEAEIIPEPDNPHDPEALSVRIGGKVIGYIPKESIQKFKPLISDLILSQAVPVVRARIWAVTRQMQNGQLSLKSAIRIDIPETLKVPSNPEPDTNYVVLPTGRTFQVSGEAEHFDKLGQYVDKYVLVILKIVQQEKNGTVKEHLDVHLDGEKIGHLSPRTSASLIPIVKYFEEKTGMQVASWANVKGSRVAAEIVLNAARADELKDEFFDSEPSEVFRINHKLVALPPSYQEGITYGAPPQPFKLPIYWLILLIAVGVIMLTSLTTIIFSVGIAGYLTYYYLVQKNRAPKGAHKIL